jgi:hypothetical protein
MNSISIALTFMSLWSVPVHADLSDDCTQFWNTIRTINERFESHKDIKIGEKLLEILPSNKIHAPAECKAGNEAFTELNRDKAFRKKLLSEGKAMGYRISFRLMFMADGVFAEDLNAEVAATIASHPTQFLKYLKDEKGDTFCPKDLVQAISGINSSDSIKKPIFEKRIAALKTVKDPDLDGLKADCLKAIQTEIVH